MKQGIISSKDHAKLIKQALKGEWIDDLLDSQGQLPVNFNPYDKTDVETFLNATLLLSINKGKLELFKKAIQKNANLSLKDNLPLRLAAQSGESKQLKMVNLLLKDKNVLAYVNADVENFINTYPQIKMALTSQQAEHIAFRTEFDRLTGRQVNARVDATINNMVTSTNTLLTNPTITQTYSELSSSADPMDQMFMGFFNSILAQANQGLNGQLSVPSTAAPKQQPAAPKQQPAAPKQQPAAPKQQPAAPKQPAPSQSADPATTALLGLFGIAIAGAGVYGLSQMAQENSPSNAAPKAAPKKAAPKAAPKK